MAVGHNRKYKEYTFHISQEDLVEGIEILCPLSIKQEKYLNDDEHDIVVWGGAASAGKTQLSLLRLMLAGMWRSEEHTSELQSRENLVCRLLLEKKKNI